MKPIKTADGSHTFYIEELDEHYHSIHGALQESMHVFIDAGLSFCAKKSISIFEMGFGTGLNAYLTYIFSQEQNKSIDYHGIEAYPIKKENAALLNYNKLLAEKASPIIFEQMHACSWNKKNEISNGFSLHKIEGKIQDFELRVLPKFDIVYYDAFAFSAQPDLWDIPVLQKMYDLLNKDGFLITYCAKGIFKRNLKQIGFTIENLPGPSGKREMVRAFK